MKPTREVKSNDTKAPRMRKGKFSTHVVTTDLWKRFVVDYPEYKDLSLADFRGLWDDIAETIRYEAIHNPLGVKLGGKTGELKYQYLPHKFKAENIPQSIELGRSVNYLNINTKGKVGKVKWERRWAVKFNKILQFFGFEPHREIVTMAKKYTDENPDSIRTSRNTLGGFNPWRNDIQ